MENIPTAVWVIGLLVAAPYAFYAVQIGRRKKETVRFKLRRMGVSVIAYFGGIIVALNTRHTPIEAIIFGVVLGIACGFLFVRPPQRDRRIPSHVRRAVIARDLKGAAFDPKIHHLDHIVPFSKGGDHSVKNLRVLAKAENLQRGARMPKLKDFF